MVELEQGFDLVMNNGALPTIMVQLSDGTAHTLADFLVQEIEMVLGASGDTLDLGNHNDTVLAGAGTIRSMAARERTSCTEKTETITSMAMRVMTCSMAGPVQTRCWAAGE